MASGYVDQAGADALRAVMNTEGLRKTALGGEAGTSGHLRSWVKATAASAAAMITLPSGISAYQQVTTRVRRTFNHLRKVGQGSPASPMPRASIVYLGKG